MTDEQKTVGQVEGVEDTQEDVTTASSNLMDAVDDIEADNDADDTAKDEFKLPDEFLGEDSAPNIKALYEALQASEKKALGLRQKLSKGKVGDAPEKAEDYAFDLGDNDGVLADDDPMVELFKTAAIDIGLSNDDAGKVVNKVVSGLVEQGLMRKPLSPEEQAAEDRQYIESEIAKLGPEGKEAVARTSSFGKSLMTKGIFSESEFEAFKGMADSADRVRVLAKIAMLSGQGDMPTIQADVEGLPSKEEWMAMHDMEKMQDPGYRKKVQNIGEKLAKRGII